MEPLAPGTEDEPLYSVQTNRQSKQECNEQRALSLKAFLPNGKYGNVFELNYVQGAQHWFCRVCECPVMGRLFNHEIGKRHTNNITMSGKQENDRAPAPPGVEDVPIVIAPGEPIPPGFEGEVEKVTQIQERLDGFNVGPLVALEYLLELQDYDPSKEASYLCILCDKKGDPRTVLTHLASYNHITTYLQKHFPTCYRALAPYMTKQYKRNWQSGLQKIADAIEGTFGRLKPIPVESDKFTQNRMQYIEMVAKGKHFSELSGHTFENIVSKDELTRTYEEEKKPYDSTMPFRKMVQAEVPKRKSPSPPVVARPIKKLKPSPEKKKKRSLSPVSSISSSDLEDFEPAKPVKPNPVFGRNRSPVNKRPKEVYTRRVSPPTKPRRGSPVMPWQKSNYMRPKASTPLEKKDEKSDKVEEYKKLAKAIENDMERIFKQHKQNPEKHPQYNEEWKKFWNKRYKELQAEGKDASKHDFKPESRKVSAKLCKRSSYKELQAEGKDASKHDFKPESRKVSAKLCKRSSYKELQAEGKDASKHDFKPEWIEFWNKKINELHQEEVRVKKVALRKRLGLPDEPPPISFRISGKRNKSDRDSPKENRPIPTAALPDNDPEVIIIEDKDDGKSSDRSCSPWEKEPVSRLADRRFKKKEPAPPTRDAMSKTHRDPVGRDRNRSRSHERDVRTYRRTSPLDKSPIGRRSLDRKSPGDRRSLERRSPFNKKAVYDRRPSPSPRYSSRERSRDVVRGREKLTPRERRSRSREDSWDRERSRESPAPWEKGYRIRERSRERPWERHPYQKMDMHDCYKPPKVLRDVTRQPVASPPLNEPPKVTADPMDDDEINIVSVLRLLTALEEKLGSLGPKVIDLLAQALAMEKKEANSSEKLLDSEINCVLFETVKEKLKGQLIAGFVELVQEKAFKIAIRKTASLIHIAGQRKEERDKTKPKAEPVIVPGVGTVDKAAIARQIANALIAQGKTDVTQAELEQLINAVVGMAEASKNSDQPMTTANFLHQLAGGERPFSPAKEKSPVIVEPTPKAPTPKPPSPRATLPLKLDIKPKEQPPANSPLPSPIDKAVNNMEGLSDSDLQTLLQNFKDLSIDEQHGLINYLKKLEAKEPERVERLRKFVNLGGSSNAEESKEEHKEEKKEEKREEKKGRRSPFSNRMGGVNPSAADSKSRGSEEDEEQHQRLQIDIDSDEEEYSFEDVAKAASKNVKEKELEKKRQADEIKSKNQEINLSDAKALITTLMNNLSKNNANSSAAPSKPEAAVNNHKPPPAPSSGKINILSNIPVSSADIAKTLSLGNINMSNIGSILGNVQNLTRQSQQQQQQKQANIDFEANKNASSFGPMSNPPAPIISNKAINRNPYDVFSIDVMDKQVLTAGPSPKPPVAKRYDIFNIGPNPGEFSKDLLHPRGGVQYDGQHPHSHPANRGGPGDFDEFIRDSSRVGPGGRNNVGVAMTGQGYAPRPSQQQQLFGEDRPLVQYPIRNEGYDKYSQQPAYPIKNVQYPVRDTATNPYMGGGGRSYEQEFADDDYEREDFARDDFGRQSSGRLGGPGPKQGYGDPGPKQGYGDPGPKQGYGDPGPKQGYGDPGPKQGYGDPGLKPGYSDPGLQTGYGAPDLKSRYGDPGLKSGYGDPGLKSGYGDPGLKSGYGDPGLKSGYGDSGPEQGYGDSGPEQGYGDSGPEQGYGDPARGNNARQRHGVNHSFNNRNNNFNNRW